MVAQATLLLFGSFFVMLLAGVPISAGIGIASIFTALFSMDPAIFALTAAQRCFSGIDSFSLLALPFFSLGGNIMNKGGIAKRLVRLARLAVGKMPGYLAATNVLANMFFVPFPVLPLQLLPQWAPSWLLWSWMRVTTPTTPRPSTSARLLPAS